MSASEPAKGNYRLITEQEKQVVAVLAGIGLPMRRIAEHLTKLVGYHVDEWRANRIRIAAGVAPPGQAETPTPEAVAAVFKLLYGDSLRIVVLKPSVTSELQELAA